MGNPLPAGRRLGVRGNRPQGQARDDVFVTMRNEIAALGRKRARVMPRDDVLELINKERDT